MTATRIAASRAHAAAMWAFKRSPPSRTNSVARGISANSELTKSELLTGSSTCLYIRDPPPPRWSRATYPPRARLRLRRPVRVALFVTCFNDTLFPATGRAVVELLERLGHEVEFPLEQTCCGQMHGNSGYAAQAAPLLERFGRVFGGYEAVVSPSASCVAFVRDHRPELAGRLFELTEFLVDELGVIDVGASFPHRVTLHPTCHSLRLLRVGDRDRKSVV